VRKCLVEGESRRVARNVSLLGRYGLMVAITASQVMELEWNDYGWHMLIYATSRPLVYLKREALNLI